MGRSRSAMRAGVFHLLFNVITVAVGLVLYRQIAAAAQWLPGSSVAQHIANAHILFNTAGALVFLPLVPLCARALSLLVPSEEGNGVAEPTQPELA